MPSRIERVVDGDIKVANDVTVKVPARAERCQIVVDRSLWESISVRRQPALRVFVSDQDGQGIAGCTWNGGDLSDIRPGQDFPWATMRFAVPPKARSLQLRVESKLDAAQHPCRIDVDFFP